MSLTYESAKSLLVSHGQEHVLSFWERLSEAQKAGLLRQVEQLDFRSIARMKSQLASPSADATRAAIEPAPVVQLTANERAEAVAAGEQHLRAGKVGVLLVAGGQGSRLGFDGPKGIFPVGSISGDTLFAIHSRKILALSAKHGRPLPFYIMTSEANDEATRAYFKANDFFGLNPGDVKFFVQGMWPALTAGGQIILEEPSRIFMSPDGHGGILSALQANGMLDDMKSRGLETLFYFQVDNPMVEVADPAFIGVHCRRQADVSVKVCAKRDADEGLGVSALVGGRNMIVEYIDLTPEQKRETGPDGKLKLLFGSVAIHVFSLSFLIQEANAGLPLHIAHKKVPFCDDSGKTVKPEKPNAYKFEKFVFDVLPDAERVVHLEFAREEEFSPIKNPSGADSADMARRDMSRKFARWLEACGVSVPRTGAGEPSVRIEIDPRYALGPEDLKRKLPAGFRVHGDVWLR